MSLPVTEEVECPACRRKSTVHYFRSVNATLDPELKEALLDGALNVLDCSCGRRTPIAADLLYHDMEAKYQIFLVHPDSDGVIDVSGIALKLGATLPGYRLRIVRTRNGLVEKVSVFDSGLDDRAIEVLKLLVAPALSEGSAGTVTEVRSTGIVSDAGREFLGLLVFRNNSPSPDELALPLEENYQSLLASLYHYCPERMSVDRGWQLVEAGYGQLLLEAVNAAEAGEEAQQTTQAASTPPAPVPAGTASPHPSGPVGVRGWLLVLVLSVMILVPIFNIGALRLAAESYAPMIPIYPLLGTMSRLSSVVSVLYIMHSLLTGMVLLSGHGNAVKMAKLFFALTPVYALVSSLLPLTAGLPPAADRAVTEGAVQSVVRAGIWSAGWYVYLARSRRVRATYLQ